MRTFWNIAKKIGIWLKKRVLFFLGVFGVFALAIFIEFYTDLSNHPVVCGIITSVMASMGIGFFVDRYLKEISKSEAYDELKKELEKKIRTDLYMASDAERTNINNYIASSKTLLSLSIKDANRTKDQLKEDRDEVYGYIRSIDSKWKKILKLLKGEK